MLKISDTKRKSFLSSSTALLGVLTAAVVPLSPANAQVVLDDTDNATISGAANDRTITTKVVESSIGINRFTEFNLQVDNTLTLVQPSGSDALVNIVTGGGASSIYGTLNFKHEDGGDNTTNAFLVDPDGWVVGATGEINAHRLTISTANANSDVVDIVDNTAALGDGDITLDMDSVINAHALSLWTAGNLVTNGTIRATVPHEKDGFEGGAVNTDGVASATNAAVSNGVIRFGASAAQIGGTIRANAEDEGGQVIGVADQIEVTADIDTTSAVSDGRIALIASVETEVTFATILDPIFGNKDAQASIAITDASLKSGAIVLSATAQSTNVLSDDDVESLQSAFSNVSDLDSLITTMKDQALARVEAKVTEQLAASPLQLEEINASSSVNITGSTLEASNRWTSPLVDAPSGDAVAQNGFLGESGLVRSDIADDNWVGVAADAQIAAAYDADSDAVFIHSHSQTTIDISPESGKMSLALARQSTNSAVVIADSDITTTAGDVVLASTASENLNIDITATGEEKAFSLVATQQALNNQLRIENTSSVDAAGLLQAGALTGVTHKISNRAAGSEAEAEKTFAFTYSAADRLTQTVLGGELDVVSLDVDAETLYFANTHTTVATAAGDAPDLLDAITSDPISTSIEIATDGLSETFSDNQMPFANKSSKGAAVDLQFFDDETLVTLGGSYASGEVGATRLTAIQDVSIDAVQRYATMTEAGGVVTPGLVRVVTGEIGNGSGFSTVGTNAFLALSVAELRGKVTAEIGKDATITRAGDISVNAETQYQSAPVVSAFKDAVSGALDLENFAPDMDGSGSDVIPDFGDLLDLTSPNVFLASQIGVQALDGASPDKAFGASINMFETDNDTRAIVANGATITNAASVDVTADQMALFGHGGTASAGSSLLGSLGETAGKLMGANVSVPRMYSTVEAIVGDAALTNIGDLSVAATNNNLQITTARAGDLAGGSAQTLNGAMAVTDFETTTFAGVDAQATITARDITVRAADRSDVLTAAGTFGRSGGNTFGVSGAINIIDRDTQAWFGNDVATGATTNARGLDVTATNSGFVVATGVAGSVSASGLGAAGANMISPKVLLGSAKSLITPTLAGSGSLGLNLMQQNDARAYIQTDATITLSGDLDMLANNNTVDIGAAGAVSASLGLIKRTAALAGAVATKTDNRTISTQISGATISAATITLNSVDGTRSIYNAATATFATSLPFVGGTSLSGGGSYARIDEQNGATSVALSDASLTSSGAQIFNARNSNQLAAFAGAASVGTGGSIGLSVAQIDSNRDALVDIDDVDITGSTSNAAVTASANQATQADAVGVAASVGFLGVAGTVALSEISGSAVVDLANTQVTTAGNATFEATVATFQDALSGGASLALKGGIGAASAVGLNDGGAQITVSDSDIYARNATVKSYANADLRTRAYAVAGAVTGAAGLSAAVNQSNMDVTTVLRDSKILTTQNTTLQADAYVKTDSVAMSISVAGTAAVAGSAIYNEINNNVLTSVGGMGRGSRIWAGGTVAILSSANTLATLLGDEGDFTNLDDSVNFSGGGVAALGMSLVINRTENQVRTEVIDAADIIGMGQTALDLGPALGTATRGVVINARAYTDVRTLAASATAAGKAAIAASFTYNTLADNVVTRIGNAKDGTLYGGDVTINTRRTINVNAASEADDAVFLGLFGNSTSEVVANDGQDLLISSNVNNVIDDETLLVQAAGTVAAGGAGHGNLILSQARTEVNPSILMAEDTVTLNAAIVSNINLTSRGLSAAGQGAISMSIGYNSIKSDAQLVLAGARVTARGTNGGGDVALLASNTNGITASAGNVAVGTVGGAGAAIANVLHGNALVDIREAQAIRDASASTIGGTPSEEEVRINSALSAQQDLNVDATTTTTLNNTARAGSAGAAGGALSLAVSLAGTQTTVSIADEQVLNGRDVTIQAIENTNIIDNIGGAFGGGAGIGGAVNVVNFTGGAKVFVGPNATVTGTNDVTISAIANRDVTANMKVGAIAAAALNVIVSVIAIDGEASGQSDQANATLAEGDKELDRDTNTVGDAGTSSALLSQTGASATVSESQNDRSDAIDSSDANDIGYTTQLSQQGTGGLRDVGVQIGANARVTAANDLTLNAAVNASVLQDFQIVSLTAASMTASVGSVTLSSKVDVAIGQLAALKAANAVNISARTTTPNEVASNVVAVSVATAVGLGAGVSFIDLNSDTNVDVADGVVIGGLAGENGANQVSIISERSDIARAEILSAGAAGVASVSGTYTDVVNKGRANITLGRDDSQAKTTLRGTSVDVSVSDQTGAFAKSITAQGAGFLAGAGAFSVATNSALSTLNLDRVEIAGGTVVRLANTNAGVVNAVSEGAAVAGAGALVVSIADAELNARLDTNINAAAIRASRVEIDTQISSENGQNVWANAETRTLAGGLAGSGATSSANSAYTVTTVIDGGADAVVSTAIEATTGALLLRTGSSGVDGVVTRATTSGKVAGGLAVGVVIADAGQLGGSKAVVRNDIVSGTLKSRDTLLIAADNTQRIIVDVTAGAGGIVAGSGGAASAYHNATTQTNIGMGAGDEVLLIAGDVNSPEDTRFNGELAVRSAQSVRVDSRFDNRSASLLGVSGATASTLMNADVDLNIGGGVTAYSNFANITARNSAYRGSDAPNMQSLSGGLATGAALFSDVVANFTIDTTVHDGATLLQIGDPDLAKIYEISTRSDYGIGDNVLLDAAGAVALPFGDSNVTVNHTDNVTIKDATILTTGVLSVNSGATASVRSQQDSTASGLAGIPSAKARAIYNSDSNVTIESGAYLESYRDILLNAGYSGQTPQTMVVNAEARAFNRTLLPTTPLLQPKAIALANVTSNVTIGTAGDQGNDRAQIIAYENIEVNASNGDRLVRGYGVTKDFYLELAAGAAALVGKSLVIDIKTGTTIDNTDSEVVVNGVLRSGAYNRRILAFDENNVLDNSQLPLADGSGFESQDDAPAPEFYEVIANSDERAAITALRADVQATIDAGGIDAAETERLQEVILSYDRRLASLGSGILSRINIGYLRASEGSIAITADRLTGSASGSLSAADEADISVSAVSGAVVNLTGLEITNVEGGEISFNEVLLNDGDYNLDVSIAGLSGAKNGENTISVAVSDPGGLGGDIEITGRLVNRQGEIIAESANGSIYASGNVEGESITLLAPNGNIEIVTPQPGLVYAGPAPYITWTNLIEQNQSFSRELYDTGVRANGGRNDYFYSRSAQGGLSIPAPNPDAGIIAGGNVVLVAEYLNITAPIVAGKGQYTIGIEASAQAEIDALQKPNGSDRIELRHRPTGAFVPAADVAYLNGITAETNAKLYYNFTTQQVEVEPLRVNGGAIYITGSIVSTGGGSLEAIDGLGSIRLDSQITTPVMFNAIDLGDGEDSAGIIRIRDQSKPFSYSVTDDEGAVTIVQDFETTEYRYQAPIDPATGLPSSTLPSQVQVYSNRIPGTNTAVYLNDGTIGSSTTPGYLLTNASTTQYAPTAGRDILYVNQTVEFYKMARYKVELVTGDVQFGIDLPVSELYRLTKIPLGVGSADYSLGKIGGTEILHSYAEPADGYSPVVASVGNYDYRYDHVRSNTQVQSSDIDAAGYEVTRFGGEKIDLTFFNSLEANVSALLSEQNEGNTNLIYYWDDPAKPGVFTRGAPDLNLWPGDQRLLGSVDGTTPLIYDIDPNQRSREYYNNRLHTFVHVEEFIMAETITDTHRFRADKAIGIRFSGNDGTVRATTMTSVGDILFNRDVRATAADITVTSNAGSILTDNKNVSINSNSLTLSALNGQIGNQQGGAMRISLSDGGVFNAAAKDQIFIEDITSLEEGLANLTVGNISTTNRNNAVGTSRVGTITLQATGNIVAEDDSSVIAGSDVTLVSRAGALGADETMPLRVITEDGALDAMAQGDIDILAPSEDLGLRSVTSIDGSVRLEAAAGAIVDRNSEEIKDLRTIAELETLWGSLLGLDDGAAARQQEQVTAYNQAQQARYVAYWQERGDGSPLTFTLDTEAENALRGVTDGVVDMSEVADARVANYVADQVAFYALFDDVDAVYNADYATATGADLDAAPFAISDAQKATLFGNMAWTLDELRFGVDIGATIAATSTTTTRIEEANITTPGEIKLTAATGVGELTDGFVIAKDAVLTPDVLAILAVALPGDLVDDADGNTIVRQEDDLNVIAANIVDDVAVGTLSVNNAANDVYLASRSAIQVGEITGPDRVELRINGNLTNAGTSTSAINGGSIQIESGVGGIGSIDNALTVTTGAGGSLQFASGTSAYVDAPNGDVALVLAFAEEELVLNAAGTITDFFGGTADRVNAADIVLNGASIGTDTQTLGLVTKDETGQISLVSTSGDIQVAVTEEVFNLREFNSAAGGRILTGETSPLTLMGPDVVRFDTGATLRFATDADVTSLANGGTDIVGGTLEISTLGMWGTAVQPITTEVTNLSFTSRLDPMTAQSTDLYIAEADDLVINSLVQSDNPASETVITTGGDLEIVAADTAGLLDIDAGGTLEIGTATADRAEIIAQGTIGAANTARLQVNELDLLSRTGSVDVTLFGRDTQIERIALNGDAAADLRLDVETGDITLLDDGIVTNGGAQDLTFAQDLTMAADTEIRSTSGAIKAAVEGDIVISRIETGNATDQALELTFGGRVGVADAAGLHLVADATGAVTTLQANDSRVDADPIRLRTQVAEIDATVLAQDFHIDEQTALIVTKAVTGADVLDVFSSGDLTLAEAGAASVAVISSEGAIDTPVATIRAPEVNLFAFGGAINGAAEESQRMRLADGAVLNQYARDDINMALADDGGQPGYTISQTGDVTLRRVDTTGSLEVGIVGAPGVVTLQAISDISVDYVGRGNLDLIDEAALDLIASPTGRFGQVNFDAPVDLIITSLGEDAMVVVDYAEIKRLADLNGGTIDANLRDVTSGDNMTLRLSGGFDEFAETVDVKVLGDNPSFTGIVGGNVPAFNTLLGARNIGTGSNVGTASGKVVMDYGRFTNGEIQLANTEVKVSNVIAQDEATFRLRTFDLFAESEFKGRREDMDIQLLTVAANGLREGELEFTLNKDREIVTSNIISARIDPTGVVFQGAGRQEEALAELLVTIGRCREEAADANVRGLVDGLETNAGCYAGIGNSGAEDELSLGSISFDFEMSQ